MKRIVLLLMLLYPLCSYGQDLFNHYTVKSDCLVIERNDSAFLCFLLPETEKIIYLDTLQWYSKKHLVSVHNDTVSLYKVRKIHNDRVKNYSEYIIIRHVVYKGNLKLSEYKRFCGFVFKQ